MGSVAQKQQFGGSTVASDAFQAFARAGKLNKTLPKRLEPLLMFCDHLFRRPRDKIGVVEFRLDLRDFQPFPRDFPVEPSLLGLEIDDAGERQRNDLAAHHKLQRAGRRGFRRLDRRDAGEAPDALAPGARASGRPLARGDEHQRHPRRRRHAHFRLH